MLNVIKFQQNEHKHEHRKKYINHILITIYTTVIKYSLYTELTLNIYFSSEAFASEKNNKSLASSVTRRS